MARQRRTGLSYVCQSREGWLAFVRFWCRDVAIILHQSKSNLGPWRPMFLYLNFKIQNSKFKFLYPNLKIQKFYNSHVYISVHFVDACFDAVVSKVPCRAMFCHVWVSTMWMKKVQQLPGGFLPDCTAKPCTRDTSNPGNGCKESSIFLELTMCQRHGSQPVSLYNMRFNWNGRVHLTFAPALIMGCSNDLHPVQPNPYRSPLESIPF